MTASVNWSDELAVLHEESSRDHFIDVLTRRSILGAIARHVPNERATVADLGCSSGYLLEDLAAAYPAARLVGVDLVEKGLRSARELVPAAELHLADVCHLPIPDESIDVAVSANLLEHVPDDLRALREMRRVLRSGGRAALVAPAGPGLYDYYDRYLEHERRYARGELAAVARRAGFEVATDTHLGFFVYPPFWALKKLNRHRFDDLDEAGIRARVARDIDRTQRSRLGRLAASVELSALRRGIHFPVGVRNLVVLDRP